MSAMRLHIRIRVDGVVTVFKEPNRAPLKVIRDRSGNAHPMRSTMPIGTLVRYVDGEWRRVRE